MLKGGISKITGVALVFLFLPIILNGIFTWVEFANFGGYEGDFSKTLSHGVFYLANWPALLLHVYPYTVGIDGVASCHVLAWGNPALLSLNCLAWGVIGFASGMIWGRGTSSVRGDRGRR